MMRNLIGILLLTLSACTVSQKANTASTTQVVDTQAIATVVFLKGTLVVEGVKHAASVTEGAKLYQGDLLKTQSNSRVKIVFLDQTTVVLGDHTEFLLESFEYDNKKSVRNVNFSHIKGAFKLATGKLKKRRASNRFNVRTVNAIVGVKGTEFWGGTLSEGYYDLALLAGTAIEVTNASGTVLIDEVGYGITLVAFDKIPATSIKWPVAKVQRALATVAF